MSANVGKTIAKTTASILLAVIIGIFMVYVKAGHERSAYAVDAFLNGPKQAECKIVEYDVKLPN